MTQDVFLEVWLLASKLHPIEECPKIVTPLLAQQALKIGSNVSASV
jgi:hypothetical protein